MASDLWTKCPVCNVEVHVKIDRSIWKHSPGRETVARRHGPKDPTPADICPGSSQKVPEVAIYSE